MIGGNVLSQSRVLFDVYLQDKINDCWTLQSVDTHVGHRDFILPAHGCLI